jgi:hypothetical protein
MPLHGLLPDLRKVSEEGSDGILKIKATESSLNSQRMVILLGPENAYIKRL